MNLTVYVLLSLWWNFSLLQFCMEIFNTPAFTAKQKLPVQLNWTVQLIMFCAHKQNSVLDELT